MLAAIPRIFLVGPMGAGKTTIGRRLAQVLRRDFLDSDHEIEQRAGATIPLIFEVEGEAGFRAREKAVIAELTERPNIVLATGGGAVLDSDNRRCLVGRRLRGLPARLGGRATPAYPPRRQPPAVANRRSRARLTQLFEQRDPLYREIADLIVASDGQSPRTIVQRILQPIAPDAMPR